MTNILNCRVIFYKFGSSGQNYQEAFNFRVLADCCSQGNLKKVKGSDIVSALKINILINR